MRRANHTLEKPLAYWINSSMILVRNGTPGDEGVKIESKVFRRPLFAFPVKIIELVLHDLQQISRRSPGAVSGVVVASRHVVGNDDDFFSARLDDVGIIAVERIRPPHETGLGDQLQRVRRRSVSRRQITRRFLPQDFFKGRHRLLDRFALLLFGVHEGILMLVAFGRKLMALGLEFFAFLRRTAPPSSRSSKRSP